MNAAKRAAWALVGKYFHANMRDERFTHRHATEAGYEKRSKRYELRKLKIYGHTNPLQFTGRTRNLVRTARIVESSDTVRIRYAGANTLNFQNPKSKVKPSDEFRRVTPREATILAGIFDAELDKQLNNFNEGQ